MVNDYKTGFSDDEYIRQIRETIEQTEQMQGIQLKKQLASVESLYFSSESFFVRFKGTQVVKQIIVHHRVRLITR